MYLLGIDAGSSFVKASVIEAATGRCVGAGSAPEREMAIDSPRPSWAEQSPETWWQNAAAAIRTAVARASVDGADIKAVGISYQMHGLVLLDRNGEVVRPAIIWCDSRAVDIGNRAFRQLGQEACLSKTLNSPGNFTLSKLKWVKEQEPDNYRRTWKFCLPGDYLAYRLSGRLATTVSGLSEGIMWDFAGNAPADFLFDHFGISPSLLPGLVPAFGFQGELTTQAARETGLRPGTPIAYRAGDQPNNAFSLKALDPGDVVATAGTSGVMYGVTDRAHADPLSRVNTFAHVNHSADRVRLGVLLCINGAGSANRWLKNLLGDPVTYSEMNELAASVPVGSEGLVALPFGNGAERVLGNRDSGASVRGLQFNTHTRAHLCRAFQEGIAFSLKYGLDVMAELGTSAKIVRAGRTNMFQSPVFAATVAGCTGAVVELYTTDGAQGAARGAGIGAGIYSDESAAFAGLVRESSVKCENGSRKLYEAAYSRWKESLLDSTASMKNGKR